MRPLVWKGILFVAMLVATWGLLTPTPPHMPAPLPIGVPLDKVEHFTLFALLAILTARAYPENPRWGIWLALTFYGSAIEVAQGYTGRDPEVLDAVADAVGALAGLVAIRRRA